MALFGPGETGRDKKTLTKIWYSSKFLPNLVYALNWLAFSHAFESMKYTYADHYLASQNHFQ